MLMRKTSDVGAASGLRRFSHGAGVATLDRRSFLKRSGLGLGAGAFASQLPLGMVGKAQAAAESKGGGKQEAHGLHALLRGLRD
jgi:formate dehydrogenase major subunit